MCNQTRRLVQGSTGTDETGSPDGPNCPLLPLAGGTSHLTEAVRVVELLFSRRRFDLDADLVETTEEKLMFP